MEGEGVPERVDEADMVCDVVGVPDRHCVTVPDPVILPDGQSLEEAEGVLDLVAEAEID